jgi:hypothetical protein
VRYSDEHEVSGTDLFPPSDRGMEAHLLLGPIEKPVLKHWMILRLVAAIGHNSLGVYHLLA